MQKEKYSQQKMPVAFIGHGSPMNALANNSYTEALARLGSSLPLPKAILCISAHWLTKGTFVTHMKRPKTIHDFYGFPKELFSVQYPAPGCPEIAELITKRVSEPEMTLDDQEWSLDHGTWSILKHIYPNADIPVFQLSLDMSKPPEFHYKLGSDLKFLRETGVFIVGSGNIVHNLRAIDWNEQASPNQQAIEFDNWVKEKIEDREFAPLVNEFMNSSQGRFSVPTPDHYYPLLYILGAVSDDDTAESIFEGFQNASISMRSLLFKS